MTEWKRELFTGEPNELREGVEVETKVERGTKGVRM
jgi:hypothetical protein